MDLDGILHVLGTLGCRYRSVSHSLARNILVSCPFAPYEDDDPGSETYGAPYHDGGTDRHPSMSIKIDPQGPSLYRCWACHNEGTLTDLVYRLNWLERGNLSHLVIWVEENEKHEGEPDQFRGVLTEKELEVLSEDELTAFRDRYPAYMKRRGFPEWICRRWGVLWDPEMRRVVFPIRRRDGALLGFMGRRTSRNGGAKYLPYLNFEKSRALIGIHLVGDRPGHVILVEGTLDAMRLSQYGYNAVAIMGSLLSDEQAALVIENFLRQDVILMFDGDGSGRDCAESAIHQLEEHVALYRVDLPRGLDPERMEKAAVLRALSGAKPVSDKAKGGAARF